MQYIMDPSPTPKPGVCNFFRFFRKEILDMAERTIAQWATICFRHPWKVMSINILFVAVGLLGITRWSWIDGAQALYSLPQSQARVDGVRLREIFKNQVGRPVAVAVTSMDGSGRNLWTPKNIATLSAVDQIVRGLATDPATGSLLALNMTAHTSQLKKDNGATMHFASNENSAITGNADRWTLCDSSMTYRCLCMAAWKGGDCEVQTPLEMDFNGSYDVLPDVFLYDGVVATLTGRFFIADYILGGLVTSPCTKRLLRSIAEKVNIPYTPITEHEVEVEVDCIKRVEAFLLTYYLEDSSELRDLIEAWEKVFLDVITANAYSFGDLLISPNAVRSRDDELRSTTSQSTDIVFVGATLFAVTAYTITMNFSYDLVQSKSYPALAGILSALLGMVSGMGFMSLLGVTFVPTALVCPFLVLGIGVDDVFVVLNAYSLMFTISHAQKRFVTTCCFSCASITMTTLSSIIAFLVGSSSPYVSVQNFCLFSLGSLAFGYAHFMTLFLPVLALDTQREAKDAVCCGKRRIDIPTDVFAINSEQQWECQASKKFMDSLFSLPGIAEDKETHFPKPQRQYAQRRHHTTANSVTATEECDVDLTVAHLISLRVEFILDGPRAGTRKRGGATFKETLKTTIRGQPKALLDTLSREVFMFEPPGLVGRHWRSFFANWYGPVIVHPIGKAVVFVMFMIYLLASVYGLMNIKMGLDMSDLISEDSYLKVYDEIRKQNFVKLDMPAEIFLDVLPTGTELSNIDVLTELDRVVKSLKALPSTSKVVFPLGLIQADRQYEAGIRQNNSESFYHALRHALTTQHFRSFQNDFVWTGNQLRSMRMYLLPHGMSMSGERAQWMSSMREVLDRSSLPFRAWNYMLLYYESDLRIIGDVVASMTCATLATLFVSALIMPNLFYGILTVVTMLSIDVGVLGGMYYCGVGLNMISMINLVISVGFSVDYAAHICHTHGMECYGRTRNHRTVECLVIVGCSVLHGALSTLLGVLMLGFSKSFVYLVFFKMFTMVVVVGLLHGILFLPVALSGLGPMPQRAPLMHDTQAVLDTARNLQVDPEHSWEEETAKQPAKRTFLEMVKYLPKESNMTRRPQSSISIRTVSSGVSIVTMDAIPSYFEDFDCAK